MRAAASIILTSCLLLSLAACASPSEPVSDGASADCEPTASGALSDGIEVTGAFDTEPDVSFDTPLEATDTQRTVVIEGNGDRALAGDTVRVQFAIYAGNTAERAAGSDWTEQGLTPLLVDDAQVLAGIVRTVECATVGSRVVGVISPADSYGEEGSPEIGVEPGESIVFVVDVVEIEPPAAAALPRADGADQPATEGFPTVVLDGDGRPTITIPDEAPPTTLEIALLKEGSGAEVTAGSDVVVHYVGINWNTKTVFDESWARGEPATFNTGQVIAGFTAALVGQQVGSQVIVIIPPDQGYGAAGNPPNIGGTDTLVFVVDILGLG